MRHSAFVSLTSVFVACSGTVSEFDSGVPGRMTAYGSKTVCAPFEDRAFVAQDGLKGPFLVTASRGTADVEQVDERRAVVRFRDVPDGGPVKWSLAAASGRIQVDTGYSIRVAGWCEAGEGLLALAPANKGEETMVTWQVSPFGGRLLAARTRQDLGLVEIWELRQDLQFELRATMSAKAGFTPHLPVILLGNACAFVVASTLRLAANGEPAASELLAATVRADGGVTPHIFVQDGGLFSSVPLQRPPDGRSPRVAAFLPTRRFDPNDLYYVVDDGIVLIQIDDACVPAMTLAPFSPAQAVGARIALVLNDTADSNFDVLLAPYLIPVVGGAMMRIADGLASNLCDSTTEVESSVLGVSLAHPLLGHFGEDGESAVWFHDATSDPREHVVFKMRLSDCESQRASYYDSSGTSLNGADGPMVTDVNGDGLDDIVLSGAEEDVLISNPSGGFVPTAMRLAPEYWNSITLFSSSYDADGDGHVDRLGAGGVSLWRERR